MTEPEREALIAELAEALSACDAETQRRMINGFAAVDLDYGQRVAQAVSAGQ